MIRWRIHHKAETASTNADARGGAHGDVFTADFQSAGRGRIGHRWLSPPGCNLMMSAVLSVAPGVDDGDIAALPLVVGIAVVNAVRGLLPDSAAVTLKWPNDVLVSGKKVSGILCERHGDSVVAGIGVNVRQREFSPDIAGRATSLALASGGAEVSVVRVREAVLGELAAAYEAWLGGGFAAVYPAMRAADCLNGRTLSVRQFDDDVDVVQGVCGGIQPDGSLLVGGRLIYAGEAHVLDNMV